ncbi:SpoIIE family protein phosphatase [Streptomyces sp. NPDC091376]|uniref:SpoIIE family protein phosphatase n=1 Tax=Streptomyces sp. NPDC091376 TaxID=3365994 RepID=UPI0037FBBD59
MRTADMPETGETTVQRCTLTGDTLAPAVARRFVRTTLDEWTMLLSGEIAETLLDDALLMVSELVTNAVIHAGTAVDLCCRLEGSEIGGDQTLVVEVSDRHPARPPLPGEHDPSGVSGRGLQLVRSLAQSWGVSYEGGTKTVWFQLSCAATEPAACDARVPAQPTSLEPGAGNVPAPSSPLTADDRQPTWDGRAALAFLAEASELLSGQFNEEKVATLASQLLVPRFAQWCAVWLEAGPVERQEARLVQVWHANEANSAALRAALAAGASELVEQAQAWPSRVPMPRWLAFDESHEGLPSDTALSCQLNAAGQRVGTLLLGRIKETSPPGEASVLIADFARRLALAIAAARRYTRHADTSRALQQSFLPGSLAEVPNLDVHVVYEPIGECATAGGDFYDVFRTHEDRWYFALGDVCGHGPEAAAVTGLVRPLIRILAEDGDDVSKVLDRLNRVLLDGALPAKVVPGSHENWPDVRSVSLIYGELIPHADGGVRCTLASAGHPLPLLLHSNGHVTEAASPQVLLGVTDSADYGSQSIILEPGDAMLCVTDGVTERRRGKRLFDDHGRLSQTLARCCGLRAASIAEQVRSAVHDFDETPPTDDLAMLVLRAM